MGITNPECPALRLYCAQQVNTQGAEALYRVVIEVGLYAETVALRFCVGTIATVS